MRVSQFRSAVLDNAFHNTWFHGNFRCKKTTFVRIVLLVEENWLEAHGQPVGQNAHFSYAERTAAFLHYRTQPSATHQTGTVMGMSKSTAWRCFWDVLEVVVFVIGPQLIQLPSTKEEWDELADGMERSGGFPKAPLAIDGSLIPIERPGDYEGWYCRKKFPAINALVVVDYKMRIRAYALRPGSEQDSGVYNRSGFGEKIHVQIPRGQVVLGDAGYKLYTHLMIPYSHATVDPDETNYNYIHSKTRMVVERALGQVKGRHRIMQTSLGFKGNVNNGLSTEHVVRTGAENCSLAIKAAFVLHNIFIECGDVLEDGDLVLDRENDNINVHHALDDLPFAVGGVRAKRVRDSFKQYLTSTNVNRRNRQQQ
jgi:hypothetical protein